MKTSIHIIGTGTIGEPLIGLLSRFKNDLGADDITFFKRTPRVTDRPKLMNLIKHGAKLCADEGKREEFCEIGLEPVLTQEEALENATVVIDCTPVGNENKEKFFHTHVKDTRGFSPGIRVRLRETLRERNQ